MKDRSAVSTLKGYFYQFDFTILQLLKLDHMADKIMVEGIEDVDVSTADNKIAIQCKYYEGTEYNHSEISEAVKYLLMDFAERKNSGSKKIEYMLYGYYLKGQDKFPDELDVSFLKTKFLTHRRKIKDTDKYEIIDTFKCTAFEAEHYYYNNALKVIKSIAICDNTLEREITKGEFLERINRKEILFNQWFYLFRSQKEVFRKYEKSILQVLMFRHMNAFS